MSDDDPPGSAHNEAVELAETADPSGFEMRLPGANPRALRPIFFLRCPVGPDFPAAWAGTAAVS